MKLLIAIATYKRKEKLYRLLNSLNTQTFLDYDLVIVCDNKDYDTYNWLKSWLPPYIKVLIQTEHRFVIGAWNRTVKENINKDWDGFIGLCDDVELHPEALEEIVCSHQHTFPDTDGVLGFKQECPGHPEYSFKWFGQTLIGRKFVERYKQANYQICCPDFFHFVQDEEMHEYACSLDKFFPCPQAILNHYHPGFIKELRDETHDIIRSGSLSPKNHDFKMQKIRKEKGYLWGKDFNLVGNIDE